MKSKVRQVADALWDATIGKRIGVTTAELDGRRKNMEDQKQEPRRPLYGYFTVKLKDGLASVRRDGSIEQLKTGYVCVRIDRPDNGNKYKASFSFCSPLDSKNFSRAIARRIADSRMTTKRVKAFVEFEFDKTESTKVPELFRAALATITPETIDDGPKTRTAEAIKAPEWFTMPLDRKEISYGFYRQNNGPKLSEVMNRAR
jgi:hypothetical protein